jgi:hypothetical protein
VHEAVTSLPLPPPIHRPPRLLGIALDAMRWNVAAVRIDADLGIAKKIENDDWSL